MYAMFLARRARRIGPGGGEPGEEIQVHRVPLDHVPAWLDGRRQQGILVDPRVYAGLYFANGVAP